MTQGGEPENRRDRGEEGLGGREERRYDDIP